MLDKTTYASSWITQFRKVKDYFKDTTALVLDYEAAKVDTYANDFYVCGMAVKAPGGTKGFYLRFYDFDLNPEESPFPDDLRKAHAVPSDVKLQEGESILTCSGNVFNQRHIYHINCNDHSSTKESYTIDLSTLSGADQSWLGKVCKLHPVGKAGMMSNRCRVQVVAGESTEDDTFDAYRRCTLPTNPCSLGSLKLKLEGE
jgi:hypothetical protein